MKEGMERIDVLAMFRTLRQVLFEGHQVLAHNKNYLIMHSSPYLLS